MENVASNNQLPNEDGCVDIPSEMDGEGEYSTISLETFSGHRRPSFDATYNHITMGPTSAIAIDNTYAHIPNTVGRFDKTSSLLSNKNNQPEQNTTNGIDDPTNNHLGGSVSHVSLSNDNGLLGVKNNINQTDETYSHINENNAKSQTHILSTDYEDTTYNHLGDLPTATKNFPHGKGSTTDQRSNDVASHTECRYNYTVVNKRPQTDKDAFHIDDAPYGLIVLEPDTETTSKHKPYHYAAVNKTSLAPEATSTPDDRLQKDFVLEPSQYTGTKPNTYNYAVVKKQSEAHVNKD